MVKAGQARDVEPHHQLRLISVPDWTKWILDVQKTIWQSEDLEL